MKGIMGKKLGMTQVFGPTGELVAVTVVEATPNVVVQKKTVEKEGYNSVQLGFDPIREKLANKPSQGHFKKSWCKTNALFERVKRFFPTRIRIGKRSKSRYF